MEFSDLAKRQPKRRPRNADKRTSGVHLSGVNRYVLQTSGMLAKDKETKDVEDNEFPLRMAFGVAMEEYLVGFYPDLIWQPGEYERDGVICTPDGLSELNVDPNLNGPEVVCIEEIKGATWKSSFKRRGEAILSERIWMWQLAGECAILHREYCRLHVVYVMGDYRQSGPQYFTYLIHFPVEEVERHWKNVVLPNIDKAKREEH